MKTMTFLSDLFNKWFRRLTYWVKNEEVADYIIEEINTLPMEERLAVMTKVVQGVNKACRMEVEILKQRLSEAEKILVQFNEAADVAEEKKPLDEIDIFMKAGFDCK